MSTFVSVGNAKQPFRRLLDAIAVMAPHLPQPVVVQHGHTPFACAGCRAVPFMEMDEFVHQIKIAQLLIFHAGAGSVIHALDTGKCPVVMPRRADLGEHVNNHQVEFARALGEMGRAIIAETPEQLSQAVQRALTPAAGPRNAGAEEHAELRMVTLVRKTLADYARCSDR